MPSLWRASSALALTATTLAASVSPITAQQPNDAEYTAKIRELTPTDPHWKFTTELVDHLPASNTVPTPLKVLGYVPGTIGRLSKTEDLNKYFRAVEAASPRVRVFSLGLSEEGREMIVAAVADENTIKRLDDYRAMAAKLADPRGVSEAERTRLIHEAKPIYWLTGTIHAPETGSPEMLMELLYRLAVEETPFIQRIRNNVITLITPATEVDGRNRIIDIIEEEKQLKLGRGGMPTVYWGKYIAHDNNRDGLMMSIKLTQNMNSGFLHWRPTIMHDLHESVPFLYTSTGTGPYNDEFDPITVGEWHTLAYQEVNELTKRGLPGVWTHGFYDGWAPNYMLGIAQFRNSMGKFYETYTSGGADCQIVNLPGASTSKEWYRPNPPVNGIKWCIRSNINYQQSGVLVALKYVADNRDTFVEDFALKATRMVDRGRSSAPYAFVIPRDQRHAAEAADLVNYFRKVGTEVQVATSAFTTRDMPAVVERGLIANSNGAGAGSAPNAGGRGAGRGGRGSQGDSTARSDSGRTAHTVSVAPGDWIVRMDQPYTALVRTVLAVQRFRPDDPSPYDDTGWSLDELRHVTVHTIADSSVLTKPMQLLKEDARVTGTVAGNGGTVLVAHSGDWRSAVLPWKVGAAKVTVADSAFIADGKSYPAGTYIVDNGAAVRDAITHLGMTAVTTSAAPTVRSHAVQLPRIAFVHTWIETQNEGWVRHALEEMGVPFTYMSTQRLKEAGLLDRFDVVLFPHVSGPTTGMVNGKAMVGPPVPWRTTALTPSLGKIDSTNDIRPEIGLDGLAALRRFVERGGLLLVEGNSSRLPIDFGFTPSVSVANTPRLLARGAIFRAEGVTRSSPILYGYEYTTIPVYFNTAPMFNIANGRGGAEGGGGDDERSMSVAQNRPDPSIAKQTAAQKPRVILRFSPNSDSLLVSGLLDNGSEMSGRAAVVDAPLGQGHVLLFGIRPMWRYETQGSYAMVLNALANWNALDINERPQRVATDGGEKSQ